MTSRLLISSYIFLKVFLAPTEHEVPAMVSLLKTNIVSGNDKACVLEYFLDDNYKQLPTPNHVSSWDELLPNTFCEDKYDIKVDKRYSDQEKAELLLFSLASGYYVDHWHESVLQKRFEANALHEMKSSLWNTGEISSNHEPISAKEVQRQARGTKYHEKRYLNEFGNPNWRCNSHHLATVGSLRRLQQHLEGKGNIELRVLFSALCKGDDAHYACVLWSGGSRHINSAVAAAAINSGIGGRQNGEWMSCKSNDVFKDHKWHSGCLSNRANGCH